MASYWQISSSARCNDLARADHHYFEACQQQKMAERELREVGDRLFEVRSVLDWLNFLRQKAFGANMSKQCPTIKDLRSECSIAEHIPTPLEYLLNI